MMSFFHLPADTMTINKWIRQGAKNN